VTPCPTHHRIGDRSAPRPAAFFDRDGTLNEDRGYTHKVADLRWRPGAKQAIRLCKDAGFLVFVVTNQSGIARGYFGPEAVIAFHNAMQNDLAKIGARIDALKFCPHGPSTGGLKGCACRKPAPGLILDLMREWQVDGSRSFMIGDRDCDVEAARAAGIAGVQCGTRNLCDVVLPLVSRIRARP
jgi:D-glycero-D-manno-heptose 1,7-bisphosphate phosphatase